jgi:hypothetical protein
MIWLDLYKYFILSTVFIVVDLFVIQSCHSDDCYNLIIAVISKCMVSLISLTYKLSCCAVSYNNVVLSYPVLSYPVLFYPVLFCSVLFCSVLFCSVLFCSILFCSVLCCFVLFCFDFINFFVFYRYRSCSAHRISRSIHSGRSHTSKSPR